MQLRHVLRCKGEVKACAVSPHGFAVYTRAVKLGEVTEFAGGNFGSGDALCKKPGAMEAEQMLPNTPLGNQVIEYALRTSYSEKPMIRT